MTAGNDFGLTVSAVDGFGNLDPTFTGTVTLSLSGGIGGPLLPGNPALVADQGMVTFSGLILNQAATSDVLQAASPGLSFASTAPFRVGAATATQLVIITPPPSSITAGATFRLDAAAEDRFGNVATAFSGDIALTLAAGPAGLALGGTTTLRAEAGLASFNGPTLTSAGGGYILQASSTGLSSATTGSITVIAAAASQLVITTEPPSSVAAGNGFGLVLVGEDAFGNLDANFTGLVKLALAGDAEASRTKLGGVLGATASAGLASFSGLSLNHAGNGFSLEASSGGLTHGTTTSISVSAAAAAQLVVTTQPPASVIAGDDFGLVVTAEDPFGNIDLTFNGTATLALANNADGTSLGGTLKSTSVAGVATFSGLTLRTASGATVLRATSGTLGAALTDPVAVSAAAASQLAVTSQPPANVAAGEGFDLIITAEDRFGNTDQNYGGAVSLARGKQRRRRDPWGQRDRDRQWRRRRVLGPDLG